MKNTMIIFALLCSFGLQASTVAVDTLPDCLRWRGDVDAFETLRIANGLDAENVAYDTIEYQIYRDSLGTVIDTVDVYELRIINDFGEFVISIDECVVPSTLGVFPTLQETYRAIEADAVIGGGGGGNYSVTEYRSSGTHTYNVPAGCIALRVICIGGGGGGGSGRLGAAGTNRCGGSGAWSGSVVDATYLPADLTESSYTITVGAGGIGGFAQGTPNSNGNNGSSGEYSSFGSIARAPGGAGGLGGVNGVTTSPPNANFSNMFGDVINFASFHFPNGGGSGRSVSNNIGNGFPRHHVTNVVTANEPMSSSAPGGGGGGVGVTSTNVHQGAQNIYGGGVFDDTALMVPGTTNFNNYKTVGGQGGVLQMPGNPGASHVERYWKYTTTAGFGCGGGGGGGSNSELVAAGAGGHGGHGGGGGGGGGGGTNGAGSGAGGDGGDGVVIVIAFY